MKGVSIVVLVILFFISQQTVSQTNPSNRNKSFKLLPDSTIKNLSKYHKLNPLVWNNNKVSDNNPLKGVYNNMPIVVPDSNAIIPMPHYSPPPGFHSNMPVVPFVFENEKQKPSELKINK